MSWMWILCLGTLGTLGVVILAIVLLLILPINVLLRKNHEVDW
jgi:hypothetical protein